MEHVYLCLWASASALLVLSLTGAIEPALKIDGQHQAVLTLQEKTTYQFHCQSDGWDSQAPPLLMWYLNGERQGETSDKFGRLMMTLQRVSDFMTPATNKNSSFSLQVHRWDRELVCVASHPRTGVSYNATIILNVQFRPEILGVNAQYNHTADSGLSLVLFALVRSNPPATISFVDRSGQLVANSSDLFILDSLSPSWLTNHTLKANLTGLSGNVFLNASNSVGTAQKKFTLAEFLQIRVEVPIVRIVTGVTMAFVVLLFLSLMVLCLMQKNKKKSFDEPLEIIMTDKRDSLVLRPVEETRIPRENMSLPPNMKLNDLSTPSRVGEAGHLKSEEEGEQKGEEKGEDISLVYAARDQGLLYRQTWTSGGGASWFGVNAFSLGLQVLPDTRWWATSTERTAPAARRSGSE